MPHDQVAKKKNKNKNNTDALLPDCKSGSYQSEGTLNYRIYVTFIIVMTLSCFCATEYIISFYFSCAIICISFATFVFKFLTIFVITNMKGILSNLGDLKEVMHIGNPL